MKIKIQQILVVIYFILIFAILKIFNVYSVLFFIAVLLIDHFTQLRQGIKNLLYFLSAVSAVTPLLFIFLVYLPFAVFSLLLKERNFIRDYLIGFAVSYIPAILIYLVSTYFSIKLNVPLLIFIFYLPAVLAIIALKKKSLDAFDMDSKDFFYALAAFFFTVIVAINILSDTNLFMANGSREFYRTELAVQGLEKQGILPLYDPGMGNGEASFLWVTPAFAVHSALSVLFLDFNSDIFSYNLRSLFMLFLFVLSLYVLFNSIMRDRSNLSILAMTAAGLLTGLNFVVLQYLESIKGFSAYPIATLLLSLILLNPKRFGHFAAIMYLAALTPLIHPSFGVAANVLAFSLFLITKRYYIKDREEIRNFLSWLPKNKFKLLALIVFISLIPIFYLSAGFIFKDFFKESATPELDFASIKHTAANFWDSYRFNELSFLSTNYPDASRIDDHKFGFLLSFFGIFSLIILLVMFKLKYLENFRSLAFAYILHLILLSIVVIYGGFIGGFFYTPWLYLLVLLGASIFALISIIPNKYAKLTLILIVFAGFLHTIPAASLNVSNIHGEQFMSGNIYSSELDFIRQLPIDGRIISYGLFDSVTDYGISHLTGRYAARSEHIGFHIERTPYAKIHDQNSFGEPSRIIDKSGVTLSNYLKAAGYRYVFLNAQHPIGNYVLSQIYPDYSYPIYQNGPLIVFAINGSNYAEKADLVQNIDEDEKIYTLEEGYKYTTISKHYDFNVNNIDFTENPKEPEPLSWQRTSNEKVMISGDFNDNEWVVFKEMYISRWKAYMDGKEIPVYTNNHEMLLIRTAKGSSIQLEYGLLPAEKFVGAASLAGALGMLAFFLFLLKKEIKS
ncbi:hypothetical protein HYU09_04905 [Candidatus Woesearchaeota archaeon]|nr:hypothetical protein [Candidatus Woesearchaeota archaeon]